MGKQLKISFFGTKPQTRQRASRVISGDFLREDLEEIGADFRHKEIEVGGEKMDVQVWDVLVSQMTKPIRKRFYLGTKAVVLQVDSEEMFESLDEIIGEIRQTSPSKKIAAVIDISDPWVKVHEQQIRKMLHGRGVFDQLVTEGDVEEFQDFLARLSP